MTSRRWWLLLILVASIAFAVGQEAISISHHIPENHLLDLLSGLSFIVAGVVALDQRPGNRVGPLMLLTGLAWFAGPYVVLDIPIVTVLFPYLSALSNAFAAHLVLAYPSGRLQTRYERILVASVYLIPLLKTSAEMLVLDPRAWGCDYCIWRPAPWPSEHAYDIITVIDDVCSAVLAVAFVAAVVLRFRRSSRAERHELRPLWLGSAVVALIVFLGAFSQGNELTGFPYLLWQLQAVLQISVPLIFLYGLLAARTARSAIGSLVLELGNPVPPGQLGPLLASALKDPTLIILYATDSGDRWSTSDGLPIADIDGLEDRNHAVTMVERDGHPYAALVHDRALNPDLVSGVATAAAMAIENEWLHAELRAQLDEVRASRARIVAAGDRERRRVERDLHDGAQQRLLTLSLALHTARQQVGSGSTESEAVASTLNRASDELKLAIDELRELARGIHPTILTDAGLVTAVQALADRASVPVTVRAAIDGRFPPPVEATAYFVVSEALANVIKHAAAASAEVTLICRDGMLEIEVGDSGCGGADPDRGSGLRGLQDRVAVVNGTLNVVSPPLGGTRVVVVLPVGDAVEST